MIEAITSSALSAAARTETDKVSSLRSVNASTRNAAQYVSAPYYSPYIIVSGDSNKAILAIRDNDTGTVTQQYPSEAQIKAYQRSQQLQAQMAAELASKQATADAQISYTQQSSTPEELPENLQPLTERAAAQAQAAIGNSGNYDSVEEEAAVQMEPGLGSSPINPPQTVSQQQTRVMLDA